jgi:hypothetical protein
MNYSVIISNNHAFLSEILAHLIADGTGAGNNGARWLAP